MVFFFLTGLLAYIISTLVGNWVGKTLLKKFSNEVFRKFVIAVMVISGIVMLARQLK